MIERSGELPDDVDELKALALANAARADQSEADAQAARGEVLKLKAEVNDLAEANATAKAEIARLTSILKTLRRGRFGKSSRKARVRRGRAAELRVRGSGDRAGRDRRSARRQGGREAAQSVAEPSRAFPRIWSGSRRFSNPPFRRASRTRSGSRSARTRASGSTSCGRASASS